MALSKEIYSDGIRITMPSTVKHLRRLDESTLNSLFSDIPDEQLSNLIRKKLPDPEKRRPRISRPANTSLPAINSKLKDAITSLRLLDEPAVERRAQLFIGYCRFKNYTYNTTVQYFKILKLNGVFGDADVNTRPDRCAFVDSGRPHTRIVSIDDFKVYAKYLGDHFSEYTAPLLVSVYTGLRTHEILQMTVYTLYQLKNHHPIIAIKRKHTVVTSLADEPTHWKPVYNTHLNAFVEQLLGLYSADYKEFMENQINRKLFYLTPKTLGNRLRSLFYAALGRLPPMGFGVHSSRNMIAMIMARTSENMPAIQQFLQHKNLNQTRRYVKADFTHTTKEFNRLTDYEFKDVRSSLAEMYRLEMEEQEHRRQQKQKIKDKTPHT